MAYETRQSKQMNLAHKNQIVDRFSQLEQPKNQHLASYIWIDSSGVSLRFKTRTFDAEMAKVTDVPWWDCAESFSESYINTDIFLEPVTLFNDPFYAGKTNKLVLCETYCFDKTITGKFDLHFKKN